MKKSELQQIIREEIKKLTEDLKFTVTIKKIASRYSQIAADKLISQKSFSNEKDAKRYIKQMVKKYKLSRQRGFWANTKTEIELTTNF